MMKTFLVKTIPFFYELVISVFICAWLAILSSGKQQLDGNSKVIKYEELVKMNGEINKRWLGILNWGEPVMKVILWLNSQSKYKMSILIAILTFKGVNNRNVNTKCYILYNGIIIVCILLWGTLEWMMTNCSMRHGNKQNH